LSIVTDVRENRGIVELSVDGVRFVRIRKKHFDQQPLAAGEAIDPDQYLDAIASKQFKDAYEAALTSLDFSARTEDEIERSLVRRGYVAPAARAVVEKLREARLLDDAQYAARLAEGASKKSAGIYAVRRKLRAKGIREEDAEQALMQLSDAQQAQAARETCAKLQRKYASLPPREARAKLSQALARRGFSWDAIAAALEGIEE
jgi:regulatory protein